MPIVVTGRDSPAVRRRVADLGIVARRLRRRRQAGGGDGAARRSSASAGTRVAAMGDDWPDLPTAARAPPSPARRPNAHVEVRGGRAPRHRGRRRATARRASSATCCSSPPAATRELLRGPLFALDGTRDEVGAAGRKRRPRRTIARRPAARRPEPAADARPGRCACSILRPAYLPLLHDGGARARAPGGWCAMRRPSRRRARRRAPRHEADYVMTRFVVQRFAQRRRAAHADRGRAAAPLPRRRHARDRRRADPRDRQRRRRDARHARRALANGDGSEVQLIGDAQVTRAGATARRRRSSSAASSCTRSATSSACARTCRWS